MLTSSPASKFTSVATLYFAESRIETRHGFALPGRHELSTRALSFSRATTRSSASAPVKYRQEHCLAPGQARLGFGPRDLPAIGLWTSSRASFPRPKRKVPDLVPWHRSRFAESPGIAAVRERLIACRVKLEVRL